jgi:hypothetical protein
MLNEGPWECVWCGNTFGRDHRGRDGRKYCSHRCALAAARRRRNPEGKPRRSKYDDWISPLSPDERDSLVLNHAQLCEWAARQLKRKLPPYIDFDEIVAEGYVGLVQAAQRYDPARGEFKPFAWGYIKGYILNTAKPAWREALNPSLDAMREQFGELPARYDTDSAPLPDEALMASTGADADKCFRG